MKNTQRLFALLLAVVMVLSMAVTAFADEKSAQEGAIITINGATAGSSYQLYRILDVVEISDDNQVVYKLREDHFWDDFFLGQYTTEGEETVLVEKYAKEYFTVSSTGYVKSTTLNDDTAKTVLAKLAYQYAQDKNLTPDITNNVTVSGNHSSDNPRPFGLYVMLSYRKSATGSLELTANPNVFTLPDLSDATYDLDIYEKNESCQSITKQVQEDSEVENNGGWGESNSAEIEQAVHFKITVDVAPGTDPYVIRDDMPKFESIENLQVHDTGRGGYMTKDEHYTVEITDTPEGDNGFVITIPASERDGFEDHQVLTITYTAKLKPSAIVAGVGNTNTVTLYERKVEDGVEKEVKVNHDSTTTFTHEMLVTKVNEDGKPLANASFQVRRGSAEGDVIRFSKTAARDSVTTYVIDPNADLAKEGIETIVTDATGKFILCGLDTHDAYYLVETAAPDGYVLMDPKPIEIEDHGAGTEFEHSVTVTNLPGVDMPETGGMGTTIIYAVGGLMVLAAVVLLVTKKRMAA